jgi:arginyl-tRNA synthetase
MNAWWQQGVKETYQREGSYFDEITFESDIYDKGREVVLQGVKDGIFLKEEDGSVSVDLANQGLDKK